MSDDEEPVEVPVDGVLDLHAFRPADVAALVDDWLDACRAQGLPVVRLVHGKGTGALRRTVEAVLSRRADVRSYGPDGANWGATVVRFTGPGRA